MNLNEVMSQEHADAFDTAFIEFFKSDILAIDLAKNYLYVSHIWDDLIDGDNVTPQHISTAFKLMTINIPSNPLYQKHMKNLLPIIASVYTQWVAANCFEKAQEQLDKAFMLRAAIYQLFVALASIVGGLSWAEEISPRIYSLYGETFTKFEQEVLENA